MNKKLIPIVLVVALSFTAAYGCSKKKTDSDPTADNPPVTDDSNLDPNPSSPDTVPENDAMQDVKVTFDNIVSLLGMTGEEVKTAMGMGDEIDGNYHYTHKLLDKDSDVDVTMGEGGQVSKVVITVDSAAKTDWEAEVTRVLGSDPTDGTWKNNTSNVALTESGDKLIITVSPNA